jgi:hypothetical protein
MRQIAEFVAVLTCSLLGAAVYLTLVEHPPRMECGGELAATDFPPSYRRATIMQPTLAAVGLLSSIAAGLPERRDIAQHPVPRVLPPSGLSEVRVPKFMAHSGLLGASRSPIPPGAGDAAKEAVPGTSVRRSLANRLAADQSKRHYPSWDSFTGRPEQSPATLDVAQKLLADHP